MKKETMKKSEPPEIAQAGQIVLNRKSAQAVLQSGLHQCNLLIACNWEVTNFESTRNGLTIHFREVPPKGKTRR